MKQFLRSFLTLLMLVVWASGFAQEVTLDFTDAANDWKIPTAYQKHQQNLPMAHIQFH